MQHYLLVIDMQKDFVDGALGTREAVAIVPRVKEKIEEAVRMGHQVVFTRDTHGADYMETNEGKHLPVPHCIKGSAGWQLYQGLSAADAPIIDKPNFGYPDWKRHLAVEEDTVIELIGLCTDICVVSNALILKALYPEATVRVDSSACAGVTPDTHEAALQTMRMCQIEVY